MKPILFAFTCAAMLLAGCVTDNTKFPTPTANFSPKRTYAISHDRLWKAALDALDKNNIAVVSTDKSDGIIQTDYIAGPGTFMVVMAQSTRYKYNITLHDESDGSVRLNVHCAVEDSVNNGRDSTQWRDVTPQNAALVNRLETWLYEQVEDEMK